MRRKHKIILGIVVALDLVAIYAFTARPSQREVALKAASPTSGIVGGTTAAAAARDKKEALSPAINLQAAPGTVVSHEGMAPPQPAAQLAPITKGGGDVADDVPAGAEVSSDPVNNEAPQAQQ